MIVRSILLAIFVSALAVGLPAQSEPVPRPSPTPDNDVVKISTNLIQLDVTVTDSKGKAIADLRPDEIEIYENGERQKITGLSFVSFGKTLIKRSAEKEEYGVPVPPVTVRPEQVRRTVALVVDDLTLSFESAYQTRRALKKFVDEQMEDGDLVAIIRTGAGIGALQQFTSDKRILYAAIEKVRWNPLGNGGISAFAPLDATDATDPDEPEPEPGERTAEGIDREFNDFRNGYFATGTLGALDYVIRGMADLPGRKSIVLFSDGFPMFNTDAQGFIESADVLDPMKRLVDRANRASVVIYAMDPRGLVYTGLTAADNTGGRSAQQVDTEMASRRAQLSDSQDSLRFLADETGGFAVVNSNDLIGGVRLVLEDQSYYLVGYEPDGDTFDPAKRKFNKLEIKVLRAGAKVRYRSGFFNVADRAKPASPMGNTPTSQLEYALVSPFAVNGIDVRLNALFGVDAKNVPYVRSLLHVNAKDIKFIDGENGAKKAVFSVLAMSFGDNGQVVDELYKGYTINVKPDAYKRMLAEGFVYHFLFPVKKAGAYQYRVAIRDSEGGEVGSASQFVQVPDLKKKRLTTSSIVLESITAAEWERSANSPSLPIASDPLTDTALRRVRIGTVLRYGFEVYSAKFDQAKQPRLNTRIRVFRDGKIILDGTKKPIAVGGQTDLQHIKASGAIALGTQMLPGDYILQIIVTDELAKTKQQIATQFVQFEVVP
ncbi:MAG: VWA domain-containing protein [Pyrinomonadaceae bacterium]